MKTHSSKDSSKWRVTVKIMEFWKLFFGGPRYTIIPLIDSPLMWLDLRLVFPPKNIYYDRWQRSPGLGVSNDGQLLVQKPEQAEFWLRPASAI